MDDNNKIKIVFESLGLDAVINKLSDFSKKLNDSGKNINTTKYSSKELDQELKKSADSFTNISSKLKASTDNMISFTNSTDNIKTSKNNFDSLSSSIDSQKNSFLSLKSMVDESSNSYSTEAIDNIIKLNEEFLLQIEGSNNSLVKLNEQTATTIEAVYSDMQTSIIANQIGFVNDSNSIIKDSSTKTAKEISNSINSIDCNVDNSVSNMSSKFNNFFNSIRARKEDIENINKAMGSLVSITSSIGLISKAVFQTKLESLTAYDEAIERAKNKEIESIKEVASVEKETRDIENEEYIARLESEYERSIEAEDLLSANAIANKLKELNAEKEKKENEKNIASQKAEADRVNGEKQKEAEKKKNYEIAMAEYNKSVAVYNNNVKIAEMEKNHAIASASVTMAQGVSQAALGVARSVAELGPIAGLALGLSTAATVLSSVSAGVSAIKGASGNLDSVKSSAPTHPKFRYGTEGFSLKVGQSAIVGEESEVIKNKSGELQVMSVDKTKNAFAPSGITINNLNLHVNDITSSDDIITILKELKERGMNYAV